jgi:hypothetical protein
MFMFLVTMRVWQTHRQAFKSSTFVTLQNQGLWRQSTPLVRRIAFMLPAIMPMWLTAPVDSRSLTSKDLPRQDLYVASVSIPSDARTVHVVSGYAYVAAISSGVYAIDISNPVKPRVAGSVDTPGEAHGVYQLYDLLIVADGSCGLQLINKRDPKSLRIVASYDTPGETRNVHGLASTVYVAGVGFRLGVFDVIDRSRLNANGHFLVNSD